MTTDHTPQPAVHASGPHAGQPVTPSPPDEAGTRLCEATVHDREGEPEPCGRERPCPDHPPGMPGGCTRRWGDWDDLPSSGACPDCGWGRPAHPTAVVGSEPARDTEAATTPAPQADAAAVRDGRCGCRTDEEHAKVTTAFSRPADWLGGEFSRADEALSALPPWAQPVITRRSTPAPGVAGGSPAILGRALLDGRRRVWLSGPTPGRWRLGMAQGSWTVEAVGEDAPPVREVLLVDPAAGRVWDAAREVLRHMRLEPGAVTLTGHWGGSLRALAAAWDAWDGDHPAEPAPEPTAPVTATPRPADPAVEALRRIDNLIGNEMTIGSDELGQIRGWVLDALNAVTPWADHPAEPALSPSRVLTQDQVDEIVGDERPRLAEPAPEPDSGTGWDRVPGAVRAAWLAELERLNSALTNTKATMGERIAGRERDLRDVMAERDAARAELDGVRAELERMAGDLADRDATVALRTDQLRGAHREAGRLGHEIDRLRAELEQWRTRAELAESRLDGQAWADLTAEVERQRQRADTATGKVLEEHLAYQQMLDRAEAAEARLEEAERDRDRYRATLPAEVQDYWHWRGVAERLERELATARRDAAADTLDWAAGVAHRWDPRLGGDLRRTATLVREGRRPVPGSPEPAEGGGDDG